MTTLKFPKWMKALEDYSVLQKSRMRKWGCIMPDKFEIHIKANLPYEEKIKTLIHELLHFYYDEIIEKKWRGNTQNSEELFIEERTEILYRRLNATERGLLEFFLEISSAA